VLSQLFGLLCAWREVLILRQQFFCLLGFLVACHGGFLVFEWITARFACLQET
jgi:hypothetical protein